jgi:hypothetical protein
LAIICKLKQVVSAGIFGLGAHCRTEFIGRIPAGQPLLPPNGEEVDAREDGGGGRKDKTNIERIGKEVGKKVTSERQG